MLNGRALPTAGSQAGGVLGLRVADSLILDAGGVATECRSGPAACRGHRMFTLLHFASLPFSHLRAARCAIMLILLYRTPPLYHSHPETSDDEALRKPLFWIVLAVTCCAAMPAPAEFPLKDGDVWVMAGDSITAQHLHSNYFEAFCFARYPKLKFAFRNSGVGGHTIPSTLARFGYDIAAWKPTAVSVELGMNDQGGRRPRSSWPTWSRCYRGFAASRPGR